MPHINMKHFPSLTEEQRDLLSDIFINAITDVVKCPRGAVSVAFEPVAQEMWMADVYKNEILRKTTLTHIFPDYNPTDETV